MVNTTLSSISYVIRRRRRIVAVLFVIALTSTGSLYALYGINYPGSDASSLQQGAYNITATPTTLYFTPGSHSAQFQIYGNMPDAAAGNISIVLQSEGHIHVLKANIITNHNYTRIYVTVNRQEISANGGICSIEISGNRIYTFRIGLSQSYVPLAADVMIGVSMVLYVLAIMSFDFRRRWILPAIVPFYIAVATLFGQRYDTFFMISSGIRLAQGISPFIGNGLFPPSLKWEYPPLFLPYSMTLYTLYNTMGVFHATNYQLNFAGTVDGFTYMAWRAINGRILLSYYPLIKVPMILATIGTYTVLAKYSGAGENKLSVLWLLNPAVILIGVAWGQLDIISTFFLVFSLMELNRKNTASSAFLCSIGTGFKIFPVFLLPGILRESRNKTRDLLIFLAGLIPDLLIYYASGFPLKSLLSLIHSRSIPTFYGVFSTNGVSWQNILSGMGITSFPSLFLYVFLPFYIIFTLYFIARNERRDYSKYLIIVLLTFFLTYNYVNPQYFLWLLPLVILSGDRRDIAFTSSVPFLYLFLTYNFASFINPYLSYNYFSSFLGQVELIRLSLLHFMVYPFILLVNLYFTWFLVRTFRSLRRDVPRLNT